MDNNYIEINRKLWNARTAIHFESDFYQVNDFIHGGSSLQSIELERLGNLEGKKVLHLQCHFGQDSISLARMGAEVTAVDLSDDSFTLGNCPGPTTGKRLQYGSPFYLLRSVRPAE